MILKYQLCLRILLIEKRLSKEVVMFQKYLNKNQSICCSTGAIYFSGIFLKKKVLSVNCV